MHSDSNSWTASVCIVNNCRTNIDTLATDAGTWWYGKRQRSSWSFCGRSNQGSHPKDKDLRKSCPWGGEGEANIHWFFLQPRAPQESSQRANLPRESSPGLDFFFSLSWSHMTSNMFCVKFCSNIKLGLLCRDDMEQQYKPSGSGWCCFGIIYLRSVCCKIFQKPRVQSFVYDCTWVGCGVQRTLVDVVWINGIDLHLQGVWCSDGWWVIRAPETCLESGYIVITYIGPLGEIDRKRVARFSLKSTYPKGLVLYLSKHGKILERMILL